MRRAVASVVVLTLLMARHGAVRAAGCSVEHGTRVILKSETIDPDVFVWDRKDLMIAYASGIWPGTKTILQHTILSSPGTIAIALSCDTAAIRPKNALSPQDAIAVRIVVGPHRGRSGWVASDDVHVFLHPVAQKRGI